MRSNRSIFPLCLALVGALSLLGCDKSDEVPTQKREAATAAPAEPEATPGATPNSPAEAPASAAEDHSQGRGDWCAPHGLPESKCTKCNPELRAEFEAAGDWCEVHAFPESACPVCNPQQPPEVGAAAHGDDHAHGHGAPGGPNDWCAGHGLPESKCTKCNPELRAAFEASGDWCAEHEFPESACPQCNPMTPPGEEAK